MQDVNDKVKTTEDQALRWSLEALYSGLDDPAFEADWQALEAQLASIATLDEDEGLAFVREAIALTETVVLLAHRIGGWLMLSQSVDITSTALQSRLNQLQVMLTELDSLQARVSKAAAQLDLESMVAEEGLAPYRYRLSRAQAFAAHTLSDALERMAAQLNLSGGDAWGQLFDYLTATLAVDWPEAEDGTVTLSEIRGMANDPDADTRARAFAAELAAYPKIDSSLAFALNSIKRQVSYLARERGYASPLDEALDKSAMSRETLDAMFTAIRERLPVFRTYLRGKARLLGYGEQLPFHGLMAPVEGAPTGFDVPAARQLLIDTFEPLDADMAALFARAFDERWIDFMPRQGKVGGAFCASVPIADESRILTNFDGSFGSVSTLAHELGHAWHNHCTAAHAPLNRDYTMPVAETASTFNELHLAERLLDEADSDQTRMALLDAGLIDVTQTVVDIYSRFLFESRVFERCESEFMDAAELSEMMREAQRESYGDGLDPETLHPWMWACKSHYYSPHLSFYNFPYAFGALFATGLYARYRDEGPAFMRDYHELLRQTPLHDVEDAAAMIGIDLRQRDFWVRSLALVEGRIQRFLELVERSLAR